MSSNIAIFQTFLILFGASEYIYADSTSNINAVDFKTNLESDPEISEYRSNYVKVAANNTKSPTKEIAFCLRIIIIETIKLESRLVLFSLHG